MDLTGRVFAFGALGLAVRALLTGSRRPFATGNAVLFNDALVAASVPVFVAGREFGWAATAVLRGADTTRAQIDIAFLAVERALLQARHSVERLKVPDSRSAREFVRAYYHLLFAQERIIRDDFAVILAILRDAALPEALRYNRIARIGHTVACVDREALAAVRSSQLAFSHEHGFDIS